MQEADDLELSNALTSSMANRKCFKMFGCFPKSWFGWLENKEIGTKEQRRRRESDAATYSSIICGYRKIYEVYKEIYGRFVRSWWMAQEIRVYLLLYRDALVK